MSLTNVDHCIGNRRYTFHWLSLAERGLRLPKAEVEYAGMTKHDLFPHCVCLPREEYVSLFYFGHSIGVLLGSLMMEAFAIDYFTHLDEVR
jgi:hypothetical protein